MTDRYRRKPMPVEARRFQPATWDEFREIASWVGTEPLYYVMEPGNRASWFLSVEGHSSVHQGDWVVRREDGTFHRMTDTTFTAEYELDPEQARD